jgi:hypothetical protein
MIAVLEEDDVETFVAFCEYAYTGDYNVPRREQGVQAVHEIMEWFGDMLSEPRLDCQLRMSWANEEGE